MLGGGRSHLTAFSPRAFKQMLNIYGFHVERYYGSGFYPFKDGFGKVLSQIFPNASVAQIAVASKNNEREALRK